MIESLKNILPHTIEIIGFAIELIVLFLILKEIRALGKHEKALEKHEEHLAAVRPLLSTLYTGSDEIMGLAVAFTKEAKEINALGTISSLVETEMKPGEDEEAFQERLKTLHPQTVSYVSATREHILGGRRYCRIMDFKPSDVTDDSILEILANVSFFLRLLEFRGGGSMDLNLYHNPDVLKGRGDFHFRCSDRQVVLRVGGHGNDYANAAIAITDTRVVHEYKQYFQSLIHSTVTRHLAYQNLIRLRELLLNRDSKGIESYLATLPGGLS
jgi:hypothetical protein